jgi:uncharacterized protein YhfF
MNETAIQTYWQTFLDSLPADSPLRQAPYTAEPFGDSPALADELAALVVAGIKTATCSAVWDWEAEGESLPQAGLLSIVLDGKNQPICIIETTEVTIRPYNQVDAQFACDEGEGDRSLTYWREAHWRFFSRVLPKIGREPAQDMPLVCERFRLIYS